MRRLGFRPTGFVICILLLGLGLVSTPAQDRWGIHFQVYGEPHEADNPLYINVLPIVYETGLNSFATVQVGSVLGLRIASSIGIGNVGLMAGVPFFPLSAGVGPYGFFAGPIVTASYNLHTSEMVVTPAADLGYSFSPGEPFAMTLGGELGASVFFLDGEATVRPHLGPAIYVYVDGPGESP